MTLFFVALGGGLGAIARFAISQWLNPRLPQWPLGTWLINLLGSALLGLLTGTAISQPSHLLWGVGFCGAFTTFSTLNEEARQLLEQQQKKRLIRYLLLSYIPGLILAYGGLLFGQMIQH